MVAWNSGTPRDGYGMNAMQQHDRRVLGKSVSAICTATHQGMVVRALWPDRRAPRPSVPAVSGRRIIKQIPHSETAGIGVPSTWNSYAPMSTIVPLYDQVACILADKNIAVLVIQVVPIDQYSLPAAERRHAGNRLIVRCQNRGFGMGNRRPLLTAPIRLAFRLPRRLSTSSVLEPSFEPRDNSKSPAQETADQHTFTGTGPPPVGTTDLHGTPGQA